LRRLYTIRDAAFFASSHSLLVTTVTIPVAREHNTKIQRFDLRYSD
jgi:hypothetical protein